MVSFLTALPAGGSAKKRKPSEPASSGGADSAASGGGGGRRLEQRSIKQLQSQMRVVLSLSMETYLFPKEHELGSNCRKFMENYNSQKPEKAKKGEKGTAHPWGPARYGLYMTMVEYSLTCYNSTPAMMTEMGAVFPHLAILIAGLMELIKESTALLATDPAAGFKIWAVFVNHLESRETKDGRQLIHGTPGKGFLMTNLTTKHKIGGMDAEKIWAVLTYPLRTCQQEGTAPMNPNERGIQQLLG